MQVHGMKILFTPYHPFLYRTSVLYLTLITFVTANYEEENVDSIRERSTYCKILFKRTNLSLQVLLLLSARTQRYFVK